MTTRLDEASPSVSGWVATRVVVGLTAVVLAVVAWGVGLVGAALAFKLGADPFVAGGVCGVIAWDIVRTARERWVPWA